jgi:hypothetical protein
LKKAEKPIESGAPLERNTRRIRGLAAASKGNGFRHSFPLTFPLFAYGAFLKFAGEWERESSVSTHACRGETGAKAQELVARK